MDDRRLNISDRRDFPRLEGSYQVRFGVCGGHKREVPGFTSDMSLGGLSFFTPETTAAVGDHLAVEIVVPGYEEPLYFLGEVVRLGEERGGYELAVRFDWIGKSDAYREKLQAFLAAHG
ncbi:MAG: PilZ domain-containing protein [Planctomycetota bacterium]|jgi:hypothetical protein